MEHVDERSQKRHQREAVFEELATFLRKQNEPDRRLWSFLDRPIVLTLITVLVGGGIVGGATLWWQLQEQKHIAETAYERALVETKFAILRTFAATYQRSGNVLNSWIVHVLRLADEKNKQKDAHKIKKWSSEIARLHEEYSKADPLDGVLAQIQGIFSGDVRVTAVDMQKQFEQLERVMREVNGTYNVAESISADEIKKFDQKRKAIVAELETLKNKLLTQIGEDIRGVGR